jgi:predicted metal-dependent hydrolase
MLTTQEVEQYIRLTLKQWGMSSVRVQWMKPNRFLGLAYAEDSMIELSEKVLGSFGLFREVFLHELAHLHEMNHSPAFWNVVASILPDHVARRKELQKENSFMLSEICPNSNKSRGC